MSRVSKRWIAGAALIVAAVAGLAGVYVWGRPEPAEPAPPRVEVVASPPVAVPDPVVVEHFNRVVLKLGAVAGVGPVAAADIAGRSVTYRVVQRGGGSSEWKP